MPLYSIQCSSCKTSKDIWSSYQDFVENRHHPECGGTWEIIIAPIPYKWGSSAYRSGEIRRCEVEITDKDGKTTTTDLKHRLQR